MDVGNSKQGRHERATSLFALYGCIIGVSTHGEKGFGVKVETFAQWVRERMHPSLARGGEEGMHVVGRVRIKRLWHIDCHIVIRHFVFPQILATG